MNSEIDIDVEVGLYNIKISAMIGIFEGDGLFELYYDSSVAYVSFVPRRTHEDASYVHYIHKSNELLEAYES